MKRGQVTLYVIIAILIVAAVGVIVYMQRISIMLALNYLPSAIRPVNEEISTCLKTVAEDGIYLIGMQGGHVTLPSVFFETNLSYIGYGYANRQKFLPTINQIENDLSEYVRTMLPQCTDFSKFSDFEIFQGNIAAKSTIKENFVVIDVQWPISLKKDSVYQLSKFSTRINVRLGRIYNITDTIVSKEMANPEMIDLSYLISLHEKENITADTLFFSDTIVYTITDPNSRIKNKDYVFLFANKFQ